VLAGLLGAAQQSATPSKYPRAKLLMEPADLAKAVRKESVQVVDARSLEKVKTGHIPNAAPVDPSDLNKLFLKEKDKHFWEKHLGEMGLDPKIPVVVYGDDFRETARVWWILRYWGYPDVHLLNGGWQGWRAADNNIATGLDSKPIHGPRKIKLTPLPKRLIEMDQLLKGLKKKRYQIADARSKNEYCGLANTAKRNGAIPGARRLEWSGLIDEKTQRFKSPAELTRLLKKSGIDLDKPTVTYCQSGGRASVLMFALELMGARDVRNYYRSWSEWGNAKDTPIEKPEEEK
jgi:thiosulfate/3-mercaptopyruvate sulfurtransferase